MEKSSNPPPYTEHPYPPPPPTHPVLVGGIQSSSATVTAVVVGHAIQFGPSSQNAVCPHCHSQVLTRVEAETAGKTHLYALILCLLGCWPCVCVPYCIDSCKNTNHYCPSCGSYLGSYSS